MMHYKTESSPALQIVTCKLCTVHMNKNTYICLFMQLSSQDLLLMFTSNVRISVTLTVAWLLARRAGLCISKTADFL